MTKGRCSHLDKSLKGAEPVASRGGVEEAQQFCFSLSGFHSIHKKTQGQRGMSAMLQAPLRLKLG